MSKTITLLGSTGSIGRQSLDVIGRLGGIRVSALTAGTSVQKMAEQCRQFRPQLAVMATQEAAQALSQRLRPGDGLLAKGSRGMRLEEILKMVYNRL